MHHSITGSIMSVLRWRTADANSSTERRFRGGAFEALTCFSCYHNFSDISKIWFRIQDFLIFFCRFWVTLLADLLFLYCFSCVFVCLKQQLKNSDSKTKFSRTAEINNFVLSMIVVGFNHTMKNSYCKTNLSDISRIWFRFQDFLKICFLWLLCFSYVFLITLQHLYVFYCFS